MFSLEEGSDPTADTTLYELAPFLRALALQVSPRAESARACGSSWSRVLSLPPLRGRRCSEKCTKVGGFLPATLFSFFVRRGSVHTSSVPVVAEIGRDGALFVR